jgi:hypothetical protein
MKKAFLKISIARAAFVTRSVWSAAAWRRCGMLSENPVCKSQSATAAPGRRTPHAPRFGLPNSFLKSAALSLFVFLPVLTLIAATQQSSQDQTEKLQNQELKPLKPMRPGTATGPAGFIVLVPVDDRPAVGQFAQMIGAIADHRVIMPPPEMLGRFTTPGDTAMIDAWLRAQDYTRVDALVVSVDMLAYGGLIASRTHRATLDEAKKRLEFFRWFKRAWPNVPVYAFNALMRVAPTADRQSRPWRDKLARWSELKDQVTKTQNTAERDKLVAELDALEKSLDPKVIDDYRRAHSRDMQISLAMIDLAREGVVDSLLLLQDDARLYGFHRQTQRVLRAKLQAWRLEDRIPIYNGTDEGSLALVSRAVLDKFRSKVRVAVVYSSDASRTVIAPYEDHPIQFTVESQIKAAGGVLANNPAEADYTLYVNAPETDVRESDAFLKRMIADLKADKPVALADILFPAPHHSGADERIIKALISENVIDKFAAYAAWNTAGNTLGTTIPAANMRVFFRRALFDSPERYARATVAHLEFLLHRFADDYLYHNVVRFGINAELRRNPTDPTDEFTPELYDRINRETGQRLRPLLEKFFADHFRGRTYPLAIYDNKPRAVRINELKALEIHLPWPRTFEVTVDYKFDYSLLP